ncbi:HRDC domain-containing protein [Gimesia sp.]|uniref:ribonuclease D n=1 Tax=Gimesia sp. TaxID=2024833 RepID=UPI000C465EA2|nr:HRDC domain-containing protein [Gimesia sp.]MAX35864.1 ribonuclease D [Gimesia sp.]HBL45417.1 ribonuclease D [Planctomycetaceae bacterium]|tara:strand:+ start:12818 stop:14005 length:1188 start_codon:yes stop_codon:yes gene_type:complete
MSSPLIVQQSEFIALCDQILDAGIVAFDTEFVSEFTYRPELSLLQFAVNGQAVAVDPYEIDDLSPWWDIMTNDTTTVVVHGGREEVRFCRHFSGKKPQQLIDLQIAEGLRSRSFPISYTALVARVLNEKAGSKETRTDWRRRPLTQQQIKYALDDVKFVLKIWKIQEKELIELGRLDWAEAEFQRMIDEVDSEFHRENWRRVSGLHKLKPRELAIVRELFDWRDEVAQEKNQPARRILRDDLLIELARRKPATPQDLTATRDLNRKNMFKLAPEVVQRIAKAQQTPSDQLPQLTENPNTQQNQDEQVIGKLLGIALANRCAEMNVSQTLVGTAADLRHLVRYHVYKEISEERPRLMAGWRADVCGDLLTDVLDGKISMRVADPESDHPLHFERLS